MIHSFKAGPEFSLQEACCTVEVPQKALKGKVILLACTYTRFSHVVDAWVVRLRRRSTALEGAT